MFVRFVPSFVDSGEFLPPKGGFGQRGRKVEWTEIKDLQDVKWACIAAPLRLSRYGGVPQLWFPASMIVGGGFADFQLLAALIIALSEEDIFHLVEHAHNLNQLTHALQDLFEPREPTDGGFCSTRGGLINLRCGNLGWNIGVPFCVMDICLPDTPPRTFDEHNPAANCARLTHSIHTHTCSHCCCYGACARQFWRAGAPRRCRRNERVLGIEHVGTAGGKRAIRRLPARWRRCTPVAR